MINFTTIIAMFFSVSLLFSQKKDVPQTIPKYEIASKDINFLTYLSQVNLPEKLSFCGENIPLENDEVRERAEREFYLLLQQPGQIIIYFKRAGRYFPIFEKVIREKNLPNDLKYLSVAESALFMSRSGKEAVGLWQFMSETGKKLGLRIDDYVDERRNPEKSTRAAMEYLKQGYNANNKSWMLAAAGYNMGHTGLGNSVSFQDTDNFFELFLNEETSRYIFRIAIIKEIMDNPQRYGINTSSFQVYKSEKTKTIKVNTGIDNLTDWAKKQGTTYKKVKLLNPWILKQSLNAPKEYYEIMVPVK